MVNSMLDSAMISKEYNNTPNISGNVDKTKLKEQTDNFEALIIKMLLDESMKDEKNIFTESKDPGDRIFKSMYRDELAKSSSGGFGFSQMLYNYLSEKSKSL